MHSSQRQATLCAEALLWRNQFRGLANAPLSEKLELKRLEESAMDTAVEDEVVPKKPTRRLNAKQPAVASFARDNLFKTPSAFIKHLLSTIPAEKQLTRSQTLFIVQFAAACDNAWADEQKPPEQRRTHHMLLLGAGGTGKTHVVQQRILQSCELFLGSSIIPNFNISIDGCGAPTFAGTLVTGPGLMRF